MLLFPYTLMISTWIFKIIIFLKGANKQEEIPLYSTTISIPNALIFLENYLTRCKLNKSVILSFVIYKTK